MSIKEIMKYYNRSDTNARLLKDKVLNMDDEGFLYGKTYGSELKRLRIKHLLTQTDLANILGVSRNTIYNLEKVTNPSPYHKRVLQRVKDLLKNRINTK